jgi:hypothetical protein
MNSGKTFNRLEIDRVILKVKGMVFNIFTFSDDVLQKVNK